MVLGIWKSPEALQVYEDGGRGGIIRGTVSFSGLVDRFALRFGLCIHLCCSQLERCVCMSYTGAIICGRGECRIALEFQNVKKSDSIS